jgi:Fe-S-cluster containining protein
VKEVTTDGDEQPWYQEGLRFECTRCGNCCGGAPGFVWVTDEEIGALARRRGEDETVFRKRYTRRVRGMGISLTETDNYNCIFYDNHRGCTVYEDRPRQCRTWPFWGRVVASPATWEIEASDCPGMNQGQRHDLVQIETLRRSDGLCKPR